MRRSSRECLQAAAEVTRAEIKANQEAAENIQQANAENAEAEKTEENSSKKTTADDILEKFIMTIRALEDEWAQFTKSKEYYDLPEDYREKKELEEIGDEKHRNKYKSVDAPSQKILDVVSIYRNAI